MGHDYESLNIGRFINCLQKKLPKKNPTDFSFFKMMNHEKYPDMHNMPNCVFCVIRSSGSVAASIRLKKTPLDYEDPNQRKFVLVLTSKEHRTKERLSSTASVIVSVKVEPSTVCLKRIAAEKRKEKKFLVQLVILKNHSKFYSREKIN